ncbi:MAG: hypothetical protein IJM08_03255 [Firmicutes bacterium]|nr:hypothetical protein [Bacillota bacterium]
MYESLTALLPRLQGAEYGKLVIDNKNDGSPEHPIRFPFVAYAPVVDELVKTIYQFVEDHAEMDLRSYKDILEAAGIKWSANAMENADVSLLDGRTVMALLVGILRADRFVDGTLLEFCENGAIEKWLMRLREIDQENKM